MNQTHLIVVLKFVHCVIKEFVRVNVTITTNDFKKWTQSLKKNGLNQSLEIYPTKLIWTSLKKKMIWTSQY